VSLQSRFILPLLLAIFTCWVQEVSAAPTSYCTVAREVAIKGIDLFTDQPEKGLKALLKARESCLTDLGIGYNLGLALYKSGRLKEALEMWESIYGAFPKDYKTIVNLAWLRFELGDDEGAHILAFNGSLQYPDSVALAHTKFYSLLRMGRYLEAYDWLNRPRFNTAQLPEWRRMAADYVTETLWKQFHRGERLSALRQVINFLVREYPKEVIFSRAKDQLVMAEIDSDAEIPYPIPLPHEVWPKTGDIDNRSDELDKRLKAIPMLQQWRKREDAYAIFAGIAGYKRLPARYFGDRDAQHVHEMLTKRGEFINDAQHVKLRTNRSATKQNISQDLEWIITKGKTNPNAKLFIYFAGLGFSWNRGEDALLVPYDAVKGSINPDTAISLSKLQKTLNSLPNEEIVVVVDACFGEDKICGSGDFNVGSKVGPTLFSGNGAWAVSALDGGGKVHGSGRQGAFTYFFLKGLFGAADGVNIGGSYGVKDGWVSMFEVFHYTRKQQREHSLKTGSFYAASPNAIRLTRVGGEK
jgi:tetratricopeptide (TPR) repeat protein